MRRHLRRLTRYLVYAFVAIVVVVGLVLAGLQTSWGKERIRRLAVGRINQLLNANLEIGRLEGSLFRDLTLTNVRLTRDGQTLVSIDRVELSYSIPELTTGGTLIRRLSLTHPQVFGQKDRDGRWNLATLLRPRNGPRTTPRRRVTINSVEVSEGFVILRDAVIAGGMHVPGRYERLQASLSFDLAPESWRVDVKQASWLGGASDLAVDHLAGHISSGPDGLELQDVAVTAPQSAFKVDGRIVNGPASLIDLTVNADRFTFQEWGRVVPALERFPIDSRFTARLLGPKDKLATTIDFHSNSGDTAGSLVLDTTVPGWRAAGSLDLSHLNLEPWFNNPAHKSDISGQAEFDLSLEIGRGHPLGSYVFRGSHAEYGGYKGDQVRANGTITESDVRIAAGSAVAYGSSVALSTSSVKLTAPYEYRFRGTAQSVDLRDLPDTIPVPHVESELAFDFDANGRFSAPYIAGSAVFAESTFVGARMAKGTVGTIDTSASPIKYTGEGDVTNIDLNRLGVAMNVAWMQEPRYAGIISGRFHVDGGGFDPASMTLDGGGRLAQANLFKGKFHDADVTFHIADGALAASYDGAFDAVDPAIAMADEAYAASLTGQGRASISVPGFFGATPPMSAYAIDGVVTLANSEARSVHLDSGTITGGLKDSRLIITDLKGAGPAFDVQASGSVALLDNESSDLNYTVTRADLSLLESALGGASGTLTTTGQLTGPWSALHAVGDATLDKLSASGVTAASATGKYDVTFPWNSPGDAVASITAQVSTIAAFGQALRQAGGTVGYDHERLTLDLTLEREDGLKGAIAGTALTKAGQQSISLEALTGSVGDLSWRMVAAQPAPVLSWDDDGVAVTALTLVDTREESQRVDLSGSWKPAGGGTLHAVATGLNLDRLLARADAETTNPYGGLVDVDATVTGTKDAPVVASEITITKGRLRELTYEKLAGHVDYRTDLVRLDLRLDQSEGVWMTAAGTVPPTLLSTDAPERPVDLTLVSSDVNLGLLEGVTNLVREVTGKVRGNLHVTGTTRTPVLEGKVEISAASFVVDYTGAQYHNGNASIDLARDRIAVSAFHLEDRSGRPLEVTGSLGTRELRVGELNIDITGRRFEVLRNATGNAQVDANLHIQGTYDAPRLFGDITVVGGELLVDEIMSRALYQPYATTAMAPARADALSGLSPWNRLSLDVNVHSQSALRMIGENLSAGPNAPLGLGSFNLRASGDVFLYKEPEQVLSVTGSLDSISGSYVFQGRRFELYPSSAVDFTGDLNPNLYISVSRTIADIETRVTISGTLQEPELRLSSTPPLDPSDILALIVFNRPANELNATQADQLATTGGLLALGFVTNSLTSSLERSLGLDILEIEVQDLNSASGPSAKVTIGEEIAPRLIARFSRQFGTSGHYDEATLEYLISRMIRARATYVYSGDSLATANWFTRALKSGIDLIFSFAF